MITHSSKLRLRLVYATINSRISQASVEARRVFALYRQHADRRLPDPFVNARSEAEIGIAQKLVVF
jgi:hypothetical protein